MRIKVVMMACGLLLAGLAGWAQPMNMLRNPGFEAAKDGVVSDWQKPEYWSGELSSVADPAQVREGKRAAQLKAVLGPSPQGQRHWGRMLGTIVNVNAGLNYRYSVWAKGSGKLKLGAINYTEAQAGKPNYEYGWQEPAVTLGAEWQEVVLVFAPLSEAVIRVAVVAEVEGEAAVALVDEASLTVARKFAGTLQSSGYAMVPPGQSVAVAVTARREDGAAVAGAVRVTARGPEGVESKELALDEAGKASYQVAAGAAPGLVRVDFVQAELGSAATSYVDVVSQGVYDEFAAAAKATKLQTPCHILYLGDSLTDFSRGQNYTDQISFWLQRAHGSVSFKNAGVGGDYITRMWQRMNGEKGVHRLEAYQGLYEPKPQRIFLMLGHNDSKLSSKSGFTETTVKLEDYKAEHRLVIERLRQETGAQVTLLTNTSSVYEITKANVDKMVAAGRAASLFGKPEVMEQFNAALREVAKELGCDVVDVYEPTRTHPNKPSLFSPTDGVHLSLEGNRLIALEVLKHLGK